MTRVLAVRLDSDGDVLLAGPAVRALRHGGPGTGPVERVDLLGSPAGRQAAGLLPGVDDVLVFDAPWTGYRPSAVNPAAVQALVADLAARRYDRAVVFTSFHQSPLPMALLLRLAGVPFVAADSADYPGALLDVRHRRAEVHEAVAALQLAEAAGGALPPGDAGLLAVRRPLPPVAALVPAGPYVVLHPGASVPARAPLPGHAAALAAALRDAGWPVVVTGGPAERDLGARVARQARATRDGVTDLSGRTDLAQLAAVLAGAAAVVVGNTGPAHLAAAVGTPVVSLFSPVVPAARWAPYGVPSVLLGDQQAPCRGSRARDCPVAGHPCLTSIAPERVVAAVAGLAGPPRRVGRAPSAGTSHRPAATTREVAV
ncbi:glycosyltransferase family 9 protein [Nakamurella endophytica]|uniref:Glycosyl transferase n=1 Tax=Nakamurella endophytica TaxID=1748367 RepID=A0A917T3M7_9ACTN|nr:glycosyltransferase family 9 protein [Nakamurella endophytica]GGM08153.1 glycosyl transferase [Nakamurella endophytica]